MAIAMDGSRSRNAAVIRPGKPVPSGAAATTAERLPITRMSSLPPALIASATFSSRASVANR